MMLSAMLAATMLLAQTTPNAAPAPAPSPGAPASPATTVSPATVTAPPKAGTIAADKLVCKEEPILGSRMTKKVCYQAKERALQLQDERQNLERIQDLSSHQH